MRNFHLSRRAAFVLIAFCGLFLTQFSVVRAEGYQISQNLKPNVNQISDQRISPDSKYAVYRVISLDQNNTQFSQLFSVDLATRNRKALTPVIGGSGKFLGSFEITPDSLYVVYTASFEGDANFRGELYSIPIAANNQNQRKNIVDIPASSSADVFQYGISPDSLHVVYQLAEISAANEFSTTLFRVAPTGGAATQLNPQVAGAQASNFLFAPDSSRIAYQYFSPAGQITSYQSVALDGTGRKTLTERFSGEPAITSDSRRLVFTADFSPAGDRPARLYSITLTGVETRRQLSRNGEEVFNFKLAGNTQSVFYAFKPRLVEVAAPTAFGFVPADDSSAANSYVTGKEIFVNNIAVSSDNETVVYIAGDFAFSQLYSLTFQNGVPIERQLSVAAADQPAFYAISDFKIAANSGRVVFRAGQNGSSPLDLYSAAILDNSVAVKLNTVPTEDTEDGLFKGVGLYFPLPNSPRVVFTYIPDFGKANIYSNAVTGGAPVILAANADDFFSDAVQLTADGRRVVYKKTITDEFGNFTVSLWAVNVPQ